MILLMTLLIGFISILRSLNKKDLFGRLNTNYEINSHYMQEYRLMHSEIQGFLLDGTVYNGHNKYRNLRIIHY